MSWFSLAESGALQPANKGRYATVCVTRLESALAGEAVLWLSELPRVGTGLAALAVATGLALRPLPLEGLKPFRDTYSLYYSDTCSPEWLRAFFVREVAKRALEVVGCPMTAEAIEDVSDAIRRYADASARSATKAVAAVAAVASSAEPADARSRERSASAVLRIEPRHHVDPA